MPLKSVSLVHCDTYDATSVADALRRCLDPLGGMAAFVSPGQKVLLKPNLLAAAPPDSAIVTHPSIVEAVAWEVADVGGSPFVADSPGANLPFTRSGLTRLYGATGYADMAARTSIELNWDVEATSRPNPDGKLLKRLDLMHALTSADVVIALPKLKTHALTTLTAATKILFGLIPGLSKPDYHARFSDVDLFADMLLDIIAAIRPSLFILDAVDGMEGDGPGRHGTPRHVGALAAGADPVALDLVACRLIGLDPTAVPTLRRAAARDWWDGRTTHGPIVGDSPNSFDCQPFLLPASVRAGSHRRMVPYASFSAPIIRRLLSTRPHPVADRCTGCGACARSCPAHAIVIRDRRAQIDDNACIRCYCCHELCPEGAMELLPSRLNRLLTILGVDGSRPTTS